MKIFFVIAIIFASLDIWGQTVIPEIHSHNDYQQNVPFWTAYSSGCTSIEIDLVLENDTLFAAHNTDDILRSRVFESVYVKPLSQIFSEKKCIYPGNKAVQLLLDIKGDPIKTTKKICEVLSRYPNLFDPEINKYCIKVVLTGNVPAINQWSQFPSYLLFDGRDPSEVINANGRISLVSRDFSEFSAWNGKGRPIEKELGALENFVTQCHSVGAKVRFWGTPDSKTAYNFLYKLGVDFVNTDHPVQASQYFESIVKNRSRNINVYDPYLPSFSKINDSIPVENIILFIGDGMGLNQLASGYFANNQKLVTALFRNIGLSVTCSADNFTTDSAAGGTAIACGEKTRNRYIGLDTLGNMIPNIMELAKSIGMKTGIITTDRITGATPAAFYAHQIDRDMEPEIIQNLLHHQIDLIVGYPPEFQPLNFAPFVLESPSFPWNLQEQPVISFFDSKKEMNSENRLSELTKSAIHSLDNKDGFFLMVECSGIDSYGHANNYPGIVNEVIELDRAVSEAARFADRNTRTLIVVTADHETGGLVLPDGDIKQHITEGHFYSNDHTASWVPVLSYGNHSELFTGVYQNNALFSKFKSLLKVH